METIDPNESQQIATVVKGEDSIAWFPILPSILSKLTDPQFNVQVLDVTDYSFPKFRMPPSWQIRRYISGSDSNDRLSLDSAPGVFKLRKRFFLRLSEIPKLEMEIIRESSRSLLMTLFADVKPERHLILYPLLDWIVTRQSADLYQRALRLFLGTKRHTVYLPNGRFPYQKAIVLAAKKSGAKIMYYERGFSPDSGYFLGEHDPQDREAWQLKAKVLSTQGGAANNFASAIMWVENRSNLITQENEFSQFWPNRRASTISSGPEEDIAVSFFTSSQDEYWALGNWQGFGWTDQYEAFLDFASRVQGRKVLRVHPNFINKSFGHALDEMARILWLKRRVRDLEIVWPNDRINSYDLLERSSRVFVHGSTIGLESSATSKSVWNSGSAFYDSHADVRNFKPNVQYGQSYFEPWLVDNKPTLSIIEALVTSDLEFGNGLVVPKWISSKTSSFLRAINLALSGSFLYVPVLAMRRVSMVSNKIMVSLAKRFITLSRW